MNHQPQCYADCLLLVFASQIIHNVHQISQCDYCVVVPMRKDFKGSVPYVLACKRERGDYLNYHYNQPCTTTKHKGQTKSSHEHHRLG